MAVLRDMRGRFVKGHQTNVGRKMSPAQYKLAKNSFFKKGNEFRNTGRTRFKKGRIRTVDEISKAKQTMLNFRI